MVNVDACHCIGSALRQVDDLEVRVCWRWRGNVVLRVACCPLVLL